MRAVMLNDYGSWDQLAMAEVPRPVPGADEVLVKVAYGGLRWGDVMQSNGFPSRARATPFVAGQEAAGVVEAVGANVRSVKPGARVVALPFSGAWAEYVCVPETRVTELPDRVSLSQALIYPVNLLTAYYAVVVWAKVQPGERVLLHAAAGGVGLLALQILKRKLRDVQVVALASSDKKLDIVREHGADYAIDYKKSDYVAEINRIFGAKATGFMTGGERGGGVDVSLNGVSGPTLETDPQVIRKRGRWVIYGWAGGRGALNTAAFGYDGITIMPFSSIAWMGTPEHRAGLQFVQDWLMHEPLLEPSIYSFSDAPAALQALAQGSTHGKVVLQIGA
ncbi:MAG TPA: zinc-binding alcohol dehydrogenase family protein [Polyangiales bacterium]|nr:zinc-binding alcohol dehydrogenase family protein [Polyangiales bacterium]